MQKKRISIKDISELAGVSVATVSRVINKNGRYSKKTEKKILEIIEKYNYRPNQIARGLRTRNTHMIGMIVPDITNEFFAKITRHVEKGFFAKGYSVFICNSDENIKNESKYLKDLISKGVLALIYIAGPGLHKIENLNIPTVFIDREPYEDKNIIVISSDNLMGGRMAAEKLTKNGCKKFLLIRDECNISTQEDRQKGFLQYLKECGFDKEDVDILHSKIDYDKIKEKVTKYFVKHTIVDGIFATTDLTALATMDALMKLGVSIPDKVKIIGYDGVSISKYCYLPITTIKQDTIKIAELAVDSIIRKLRCEKVQRKHIVPVELIERKTG